MKDGMSERQSNTTKIAILLIAPVLAALALVALRPKDEPPPAEKPIAQQQPAPVQTPPQTPPQPIRPPDPPVVAEELDAARDTLLGLNKAEPKPELAAERVVEQKPRRKRMVREETTETVEDVYETRERRGGGGLSDAKFRETIESWRGMKSCVETSKTRAAATSGALRVSLKISGNGEVLKGRVFDESNDTAKKVGRCVEKQLASLKFPAFESDDPAITKEAKFVF